MIKRPSDAFPKLLADEYARLASVPGWAVIEDVGNGKFNSRVKVRSWLNEYLTTGADIAGAIAAVAWIGGGPVTAHVTQEQYEALSQVEIPLQLSDVQLPFPAVLVEMPPNLLHRFCIVHMYGEEALICVSVSHSNLHDVTTVVLKSSQATVDEALQKFDAESQYAAADVLMCNRVALNFLLAMANFGCQSELMFPKEVERDRRLAGRGDEAARRRLRHHALEICLPRDVVLHHTEGGSGAGDSTGREVCTHWRRGHWAKQPHGPGRSLRKIVFRKPVLVRADFGAAPATSYRR